MGQRDGLGQRMRSEHQVATRLAIPRQSPGVFFHPGG